MSELAKYEAPETPAPIEDAGLTTVPTHDDAGTEIETVGSYYGASRASVTPQQAAILLAPALDEHLDILPTGEVYASQVQYRRRLNDAFGPGGWALIPRGQYRIQGLAMIREYGLYAGGRFISEAFGEADYQPDNSRMTWATTTEAVKSNAIMRCCKDLGLFSECWDRQWSAAWKAAHAVKVWRPKVRVRSEGDRWQWRRKNAEPFWDESGSGSAPATSTPPSPPAQNGGAGGGRISGRVTSITERAAKGKAEGKTSHDITITPAEGEALLLSTLDAAHRKIADDAREGGYDVECWYTSRVYNGRTYHNIMQIWQKYPAAPDPADNF